MKTWLFTPAFCKSALLLDCIEHLYSRGFPLFGEYEHVIIDNHYPIKKEHNRQRIKDIAKSTGCVYVDSGKDLGLHHGLNNAMRVVGVKPDDLILGCDPDDRPQPQSLQALQEVMALDPTFAILGLSFSVIHWRKEQGVPFKEAIIGNHRVWVHPTVEMWNVAAFNTRFILDIGGFKQSYGYYGGIESALSTEWQNRQLKLGYLPDCRSDYVEVNRSDPNLFDPEYTQWKHEHVGGFPGSFEQWLKLKKPLLL